MNCKHQFFKIDSTRKPAPYQSPSPRVDANMIYGVVVGCALCGDVRKVFEDGTIQVVVDKSKKE